MDKLSIVVNILIGALIPGLVLWLVGKKVKYDFAFWKLLIITGAAAIAKQLPVGGLWISLAVYYGLFCLLTRIGIMEAMWMSFLAFLVCAGAGFVLMLSAGSLYAEPSEPRLIADSFIGRTDAVSPIAEAVVSEKKFAEAPDWIQEKYKVGGIAWRGDVSVAIINGQAVVDGDVLEGDLRVCRIESDQVFVRVKDELFSLSYSIQ